MKINAVYMNAVCFLALALLPPFFSVFLSESSSSFGLLISAGAIFTVLLQYVKFTKVPTSWIGTLAGVLVWVIFITPVMGDVHYQSKSYFSLLGALFLFCFILLAETWFERCSGRRLYRLIDMMWKGFFLIGWAGVFLKVRVFGYAQLSAAVFPFSEPSHFAIVAGPIYVISFFILPNKARLFIVTNMIFQAMLLQNLSLLFYVVMIIVSILQIRSTKFIAPIIMFVSTVAIFIAIFIANPAYLKYCTSRLTLSSKSSSLTVLAARQGIYAARDSLRDTMGLGLGFQMLGTEKPNEITKIITNITHGIELTRPEGGFVAAKLIAEFGVAGVIVVGLIFLQMSRSFFWLRRYCKRVSQHKTNLSECQIKLVVAHSLIIAFFIEMFIRGVGYFSLGVILFVFSLLYIRKQKRRI